MSYTLQERLAGYCGKLYERPNTMTTHTIEVQLADKNPEKVHSRVFAAAETAIDPILKAVYLMRPAANNHTKAKITVEFLD